MIFMEIGINDYDKPDHFRALREDSYNVSRTCEYEKNEMHHIHVSCEILFAELGTAVYTVSGRDYRLAPGDVLVIGSMEHHQRRIETLPFQRYGLTLLPSYYESLQPDEDLKRLLRTPTPEDFVLHYKQLDPEVFADCVHLLEMLYAEQRTDRPFRALNERSIVTQLLVTLFRAFGLVPAEHVQTEMDKRMADIKLYIDTHYRDFLDLQVLSGAFYLHPVTISKEFKRCFGQPPIQYINSVRVCMAARLLETTRRSITDIALFCGYDNVNTFLRRFKAVMNTSPLQYRKATQTWLTRNPLHNPTTTKKP